ncbi:MAG TPA: hypothetical protein PK707_02855 [Candidatus Syntrophosphaera thermopropionivorans]|jgi:hypothetical protein|uniref:Uncharacterized protein n=1 Tax=Candidatus Syntrophosphaera thermopropionivorans TaxID=2593015 RepID=A0AC61QIQ9_9BACT|nr:hypothetical protein [Candidatus Syntrophosphaera thermopropionivorans]MBP7899223.1 hypothetical protein [Candidatus Syntrophosphaera sp.]NLA44813.1 hypothetical protein [Candidatus Cloacimonadota bacterium]MBP7932776.1 hypothetical protein [Candidatus Syntrophosphaera sp.]TDF72823.1 hypothetical protein E0946_04915 [Candidatus Syntrophosphaera thermopropionivorans]HNU97652.1 hypothetical protein [Candidatus Syntrophosphaera thermopropionivorans]
MNRSFFFILILITLVLTGWSYVHYQYLESREFRLNQLSELPIFVYMDDLNHLEQLARELLETIPEIDSLFLESGLQAAQEMLSNFPELGIEPNTLTEYHFPNILTITFKPMLSSFSARDMVLQFLHDNNVPSRDIDDQNPAWSSAKKELDFLNSRWSQTTFFIAITVFLMIVFARLYLYLQEAMHRQGKSQTLLEKVRASEINRLHNALLLTLPILINIALYYILLALNKLSPLINWSFFLVQLITLVAAIITAILVNNLSSPGKESSKITVAVPVEPKINE